MKLGLAIFLAALSLGGCSSSMTRWIWGGTDSQVDRTPAMESADNTTVAEREIVESSGGTVDPATGEMAALTRQASDTTSRGFRRNADPWSGAPGPYNEGSLWNPETQDSFYFTKNLTYRVGDILMLAIDPELSETINSRMTGLYKPSKPSLKSVIADEAGKAAGAKVEETLDKATNGSTVIGEAVAADVKDRTTAALTEKKRYFTTKEIPVRVTEVTTRGMLKIAGIKKLFLKTASFDLNIAGMIREEDINGSRLVASSRLLDSKVELTK